jgi:GMP synthase-like glutamine amidotransferase
MPRRRRAVRPLADGDPARKHHRFLVCARIASPGPRVITVKWDREHEDVPVALDDRWRGPVRVLTIVHQDNCGPGVFADAAAEMGAELVAWRIAEGAALPSGPYDAVLALGGAPLPDAPDGFILDEVDVLRRSVAEGVPVLGICLGAEVLARALGAPVAPVQHREYGWHDIELDAEVPSDPILGGLPAPRVTAFMAHWYGIRSACGCGAARSHANVTSCVPLWRSRLGSSLPSRGDRGRHLPVDAQAPSRRGRSRPHLSS